MIFIFLISNSSTCLTTLDYFPVSYHLVPWSLSPRAPNPSSLTHLWRSWAESTASWGTAFFNTFHPGAEVELHMEPLLRQWVLWGITIWRVTGRIWMWWQDTREQQRGTRKDTTTQESQDWGFRVLPSVWDSSIIGAHASPPVLQSFLSISPSNSLAMVYTAEL